MSEGFVHRLLRDIGRAEVRAVNEEERMKFTAEELEEIGRQVMATDEKAKGGGMSDELRAEFLRLLTVDSDTKDARRREFNQAIFNAEQGHPIWVPTDGYLFMVMDKFDRAVKNVGRKK